METKDKDQSNLAKQTPPPPTTGTMAEPSIIDEVLNQLNSLIDAGGIQLPPDYSAANALRTAWLILLEQVNKDKVPVLKACTRVSVINALYKMVTQGMNPAKLQCYFVPRGNALVYQRSYFGNMALAMRMGGVKRFAPQVIYEADVFEYLINEDGDLQITKHVQKMENINPEKIKGVYVIVHFSDGRKIPYMQPIARIKKAWMQGEAKGDSPAHRNFPDEMAKRTTTNFAAKAIINSSSDADLFDQEPEPEQEAQQLTDKPVLQIPVTTDTEQPKAIEAAPEEKLEQPITTAQTAEPVARKRTSKAAPQEQNQLVDPRADWDKLTFDQQREKFQYLSPDEIKALGLTTEEIARIEMGF